MELDDMKLVWQALDRRLQQVETFKHAAERVGRLDAMRHGLRPLLIGQTLQLLTGALIAGVAVAFWTTHVQVMHQLVAGLLMQAFGLLVIAFSIHTVVLVRRIDYSSSVLVIQRRLADLRYWRVRIEAPVNGVLGCFIWILALWMSLVWHGVDVWSPGFVHWSLATGLAGLVLTTAVVIVLCWLGLASWLENHLVGRSVRHAEAMLAEVTCFEQE